MEEEFLKVCLLWKVQRDPNMNHEFQFFKHLCFDGFLNMQCNWYVNELKNFLWGVHINKILHFYDVIIHSVVI